MFIAVDQSNSAKHFVVASFWLPLASVLDFERKVLQLRIEQKYWREAHFAQLKKIDGRAFEFIKSLLSIAINEDQSKFAVIIAAQSKASTEEHFAGRWAQRDAVFMYELISRRYRWWQPDSSPFVLFDDITNHTPPDGSGDEPEDNVSSPHVAKARELLALYIGKDVSCFSPCSSHISSAVQIADLLAGMTSLRWLINAGEFSKVAPNPGRLAMLEWFEGALGTNLGVQTIAWEDSRVSVWKHNSIVV